MRKGVASGLITRITAQRIKAMPITIGMITKGLVKKYQRRKLRRAIASIPPKIITNTVVNQLNTVELSRLKRRPPIKVVNKSATPQPRTA